LTLKIKDLKKLKGGRRLNAKQKIKAERLMEELDNSVRVMAIETQEMIDAEMKKLKKLKSETNKSEEHELKIAKIKETLVIGMRRLHNIKIRLNDT